MLSCKELRCDLAFSNPAKLILSSFFSRKGKERKNSLKNMYIDPGYESRVVLEQLKGRVLVSNAQNLSLISFRQLGVQS